MQSQFATEVQDHEVLNHVKELYAPFTDEEISNKIAQIITDKTIQAEVAIIFQSVEDLHQACPKTLGIGILQETIPPLGNAGSQ